jgi:Flp pilus assembly protein TadG
MIRHLVSSIRFRLSQTQDEDGSNLVEFALSVMILVSTMLGIMASSLAAYSYFYVSDAAREATRYAIVRGSTLGSDCTAPGYATCIAQTGDISTYVKNLGFPGINAANLKVVTTWLTSTGGACGTGDSCKAPGNQVQVTVTYTAPFHVPFVPTHILNMTSTSQMFIAQ